VVKEIKQRTKRSWKIGFTSFLIIAIVVVRQLILKDDPSKSIEVLNFERNFLLPFIFTFFPICIFLTWKTPKWVSFLDKKTCAWRKKIDSLVFEKEKGDKS